MIAISVDPPEKTKELQAKLKVNYPLLSDIDLSTIRAYGVEDHENGIAWPAVFIVSSSGIIRWRSLAETYKVRPLSQEIIDALRK